MLADGSPLSAAAEDELGVLLRQAHCIPVPFGLGFIMPVSLAMSLQGPLVHLEFSTVIASFHAPLRALQHEKRQLSDCLTWRIVPR